VLASFLSLQATIVRVKELVSNDERFEEPADRRRCGRVGTIAANEHQDRKIDIAE